jgi:gluconolactonase
MHADGEIVVTGLRFPEGPVWTDGAVYVMEIDAGTVARWSEDAGLERVATTAGGPNGATLGSDGALYVTQNGGIFGAPRVTAGIQRVTLAGEVAMVATEVAGLVLDGPNDLAFGPDGRLYFTDPRNPVDPDAADGPGRLFALDLENGSGELLAEVGDVYPNGIGFLADGTLVWTESGSRRVMAMRDGVPEVLVELPARHLPDGMCVGADGTLYVASTYGHCVSVVVDGVVVDRLMCGNGMATNCCFGGTDLYVTESRHGALWRFALAVEGLTLHTGRTG